MKIKWIEIITIVLVIISLGVAVRSCDIANEALEISNNQFYQINKPFIASRPIKYPDGKYIIFKREGKVISIDFQFEVKNLGNVAAANITYPEKFSINEKRSVVPGGIEYKKPAQDTVLGPGDNFFLKMHTTLNFDNEEIAKKEYNEFQQGEPVNIQSSVFYENDINRNQKFQLLEEYVITIDSNYIVKSALKMDESNKAKFTDEIPGP